MKALLPLSVFPLTRKISCYDIFGVLEILTILDYWGAAGLIVGLLFGVIGIEIFLFWA